MTIKWPSFMKTLRQGSVSFTLSPAAQSCAGPRARCPALGGCQDRAKMVSVSEEEDTARPVLRIAGLNDAAALMKLKQRLDEETSFMLLEPDERDTSIQALARHLEEVSQSENSVVIVAGRHGDLAGYVELAGGRFRRNRSTTHVVIGVLAEASGKGVGTGLLEEAKRWAAARGLHRIELNVMAHNHRAIALYERVGFVHEGRRVDCLLIDGKFLDELSMAMILPGSLSP